MRVHGVIWISLEQVSLMELPTTIYISKALTEKAALDFANENGLDFVTIVPTYIHGPFITPQYPDSVRASLAVIFGRLFRLTS